MSSCSCLRLIASCHSHPECIFKTEPEGSGFKSLVTIGEEDLYGPR